MGDREHEDERKRDGAVRLKEREKQHLRKPPKYRVVILNDDFTPIEFVALLVQQVFRRTVDEAQAITLEVHEKGVAVAGVYTYEIAETKVAQSQICARRAEHPLMITMEPEE